MTRAFKRSRDVRTPLEKALMALVRAQARLLYCLDNDAETTFMDLVSAHEDWGWAMVRLRRFHPRFAREVQVIKNPRLKRGWKP